MEQPDVNLPQIPEDSEMFEAFGQMSQIWDMFTRGQGRRKRFQKTQEGRPAAKETRRGAGHSDHAGDGQPYS